MANIKDLNSKIHTLRNMQKVMRAMNMIASIKLRKLSRLQSSLSVFDRSIEIISHDISRALEGYSHNLISGFKHCKKVHVVIFTADKGLCGSHNALVDKALDVLLRKIGNDDKRVDITCVGVRGTNYCKRKGYDIFYSTESNDRVLEEKTVAQISSTILKRFIDGEIQEVYLISNKFISNLHKDTVVAKLIPFNSKEEHVKEKGTFNAIIEPEAEEFIVLSAELYIFYKLMSALFNSYLSEHSSRMIAMENATNNSEDLISHYVTLQNRVRQTSITNDLIEIISGKEALKG